MKSRILFLLIVLFSQISSQKKQFTAKDLQEMNRISSPVLSPDGEYVIYSVRKWNSLTDKSYTNLQYSSLKTKELKDLTPKTKGVADSSPLFSSKFPDYLFFTRDGQIRYIKFPPEEPGKDNSFLLTNYPISINDFKIKNNAILFSAEVYFLCMNDLNCSADLIEKEGKQDYQVYDSLFALHWDTWLVQGKGSHIFYQKIKLENDKIVLDGKVDDITKGMEINCPPLFSDNSNYDLSNDGTKIAFSAHHRTHEEAWSTGWKTYYIDLNIMKNPILISKNNNDARTQSPQFSLDDTKIAYLAMNTPMLEADNLHFEIYNILTNKVYIISDPLDISVNEFNWINDSKIRFTVEKIGIIQIYMVDIRDPTNPIFVLFNTLSSIHSYGLPFTSFKNKNVLLSVKSGYDYPDSIISFENGEEIEIVNLNKDILNDIELPKPEPFNFIGGYNDTVCGWIFKPINFNMNNKYPIALLIHGGPESSWTSSWSYRWNPQLFANGGYAVVMVNPHGSTGVSTEFREAVRNDFGGVPYEDIINGLKYAINKNEYMDIRRVCAAGGSYGGYMINWIEGHNDDELVQFKCLVNHDGDFSGIAQFYGTDELWYEMTEYCPKDKTGCKPYDGKEIRDGFEKFSPEKFVKNWKTPMLVIHGGNDYRVPITEGLCTFTGLQLKGVESKFLYFPLENHWVLNPPNQVKWYEEVLNWFGIYTKE